MAKNARKNILSHRERNKTELESIRDREGLRRYRFMIAGGVLVTLLGFDPAHAISRFKAQTGGDVVFIFQGEVAATAA